MRQRPEEERRGIAVEEGNGSGREAKRHGRLKHIPESQNSDYESSDATS